MYWHTDAGDHANVHVLDVIEACNVADTLSRSRYIRLVHIVAFNYFLILDTLMRRLTGNSRECQMID